MNAKATQVITSMWAITFYAPATKTNLRGAKGYIKTENEFGVNSVGCLTAFSIISKTNFGSNKTRF